MRVYLQYQRGPIRRVGRAMPDWFWRIRENRTLHHIDDGGWTYRRCPYYTGTGICNHGCWEEPECHTCEPLNGWPLAPVEIRRIGRSLGAVH